LDHLDPQDPQETLAETVAKAQLDKRANLVVLVPLELDLLEPLDVMVRPAVVHLVPKDHPETLEALVLLD